MISLLLATVILVVLVLWIKRDKGKNLQDEFNRRDDFLDHGVPSVDVESFVTFRASNIDSLAVRKYTENYLLSRFHGGADLFNFHDHPAYAERLGESPEVVLRAFIDTGLLRPLSTAEALDHNLKATELKEILRKRGLPVTGRKAQLVERVAALGDKDASLLAASKSPFYTATTQGLSRLAEFYANETHRYDTTVSSIKQALDVGDIGTALDLSETYNSLSMWGYARIQNDGTGRSALAGILSSSLGSESERRAAALMALMPPSPPAVRPIP